MAETYDAVKTLYPTKKTPPDSREVADAISRKEPTAYGYLSKLADQGYLERIEDHQDGPDNRRVRIFRYKPLKDV